MQGGIAASSMIRLICIVILCAAMKCAALGPIMIVIGDVSENSARILYDALDRNLVGNVVEARLYDDSGVIFRQTLPIRETPRIWRLYDLVAGKQYRVQLQAQHGDIVFGQFRTPNLDDNIRILTSSCNKFLDDNDDSFISELVKNPLVKDRIGMIHLGDQLYADFIYDEWNKNGRRSSHEDLTNEFRKAYRRIWSPEPMRTLLSTGANWMVIDDHDILNNLDPEQIKDGREPLLRAGRQAFLEYQLQLQFDVFDDDGKEIGTPRAYFTKTIGPLALIFVDTRLERTFNFDSNAPFLGTHQMRFISNSLQQFSKRDDISQIILISSVPLVWAPSSWVSRLPDIAEKERMALHPVHRQESVDLLNMASEYRPKVTLLSGDIHLFLHSEICPRARSHEPCIEQITTSGLTVGSTAASSLKVLVFHFLALGVGSNVIDDWVLNVRQLNVGHNAAIIGSSEGKFIWTPIFSQNASSWYQIAQTVFSNMVFLSQWGFPIALCILCICMVLYFSRKIPVSHKAKRN